GGGRPQPGQLVVSQWEQTYDIVPIESSATELPADLDALAIIHPQGLNQPLQFAIDQFLLADRAVFIAVDPASAHFRAQAGQQAMFGGMTPNLTSDLPALLKGWGVTYDPQQVVGDPNLATPVNTGRGIARMPVWLSFTANDLAPDAPVTAQLNSLLFIEGGTFTVAPREGRTFTPLVETTDQGGTTPNYTLQFAEPDALASQLVGSGRQTMAALITGSFASAFPDGAPKPAADDQAATSAPDAKPALKDGRGTLVLVADTDWLLDDYSVRRGNFLGNRFVEPLNDNLAFAGNTLDALAGSTDLVSLRGKTSSQRPFTVVRAMEVAAQQRYQSQLDALEQRLLQVQSKLSELQSKSSENGRLVATPEMQKTIDDFREQEAAMRRERRDIRRSLREDIDRLENALLAANLIVPVVFVGGFGLWFRSHRRRPAAA
ncbi:MAG: Gldg family protein, partial [Verrucomicrobiota bacterium]